MRCASGFWFPRSEMPTEIYLLTFCLPVTYYLEIMRGIILKGNGLAELWRQSLALAGFAALFFTFATLRFQKKLA